MAQEENTKKTIRIGGKTGQAVTSAVTSSIKKTVSKEIKRRQGGGGRKEPEVVVDLNKKTATVKDSSSTKLSKASKLEEDISTNRFNRPDLQSGGRATITQLVTQQATTRETLRPVNIILEKTQQAKDLAKRSARNVNPLNLRENPVVTSAVSKARTVAEKIEEKTGVTPEAQSVIAGVTLINPAAGATLFGATALGVGATKIGQAVGVTKQGKKESQAFKQEQERVIATRQVAKQELKEKDERDFFTKSAVGFARELPFIEPVAKATGRLKREEDFLTKRQEELLISTEPITRQATPVASTVLPTGEQGEILQFRPATIGERAKARALTQTTQARETGGQVGSGVAVLAGNVGAEIFGRRLGLKAVTAGKQGTELVTAQALGSAKAGALIEAPAIYAAKQTENEQKITATGLVGTSVIGGVTAGAVQLGISGTKPKVSGRVQTAANIIDPVEPVSDFLVDIGERGAKSAGTRVRTLSFVGSKTQPVTLPEGTSFTTSKSQARVKTTTPSIALSISESITKELPKPSALPQAQPITKSEALTQPVTETKISTEILSETLPTPFTTPFTQTFTETKTQTKAQTSTKSAVSANTYVPTPFNAPPIVPFLGGGFGGRGAAGKTGRFKGRYAPSFTSVALGIKSTKRDVVGELTGFGIRPILVEKKTKKRRKTK